jgi:hypothetical protein
MRWTLVYLCILIVTPFSGAQNVGSDEMLRSTESLDKKLGPKNPILESGYTNPGVTEQTHRMLDRQELARERGTQTLSEKQNIAATNNAHAMSMVEMIKSAEMNFAMNKIAVKGEKFLKDNEELQTPAGVVAGAFALWAGRSMRIMKNGEIEVFSAISLRDKSGNFNFKSPIVNGQLRFDQTQGLNVGVNRSLSSINTNAEINYNSAQNGFSGNILHQLLPNVSIGIGTGINQGVQENTGRIQYHLDF